MRARPLALAALALTLGSGTGCAGLGEYLRHRARDFGEIVRVQVGLGVGLGASVHAGGTTHLGIGGGVIYRRLGAGWIYGTPYAFAPDDPTMDGELYFPVTLLGSEGTSLGSGWHSSVDGGHPRDDEKGHRHVCYGLLPGLFAHEPDGPMLWTPRGIDDNVWGHVHAFDVEAAVYAGVFVARVGVSPGELVDFVLGWFGVDIAGDDKPFRRGPDPSGG